MKISRAEWAILAVTGLFLTFCLGWFAATTQRAEPYLVTVAQGAGAAETSPPSAPPNVPGALVDINTATVEQLKSLPGIGEKRAADIVAFRAANGPFARPEDLTLVPGIGEGTLAGLLDYITVSEEGEP